MINSQRVRAILIGGIVLVLILAGWGASVFAITWGEPDAEEIYPEVGAFFVERDDGAKWAVCTGTLIHPRIFLTAAHCTAYVQELDAEGRLVDVSVSFDFDVNLDQNPTLLDVDDIITHPNYNDFEDPSNPYDVGVLVLTEPMLDIEPADLPYEGFLDDLKRAGDLRSGAGSASGWAGADGAKFTVAGYGGVLDWPPPNITYEDQRRFGESEYVALVPAQLHLNQNRLHDNQGTCFGDSGGPAFWEPNEDTRILVGITSWGDAQCIVTGFDYRVDIPDTLDFIDSVLADLQ